MMKSSFSEALFLQNGPYALLEPQGSLWWTQELWERWWLGRTTDEQAQRLLVCEVSVPGGSTALTKIIQPAIARFMRVSQHPQMPALLNVLSEEGHTFFVFEWPGESLSTMLHRLDRPLTLQEAMSGCLHLLHLLRWFSEQRPVLAHGTICPEHIHIAQEGRWVLSHCSILLTTEVASSSSPSWSGGSFAGEKQEELIGDLPALMATMLFALTDRKHGSVSAQIAQLAHQYPDLAELVTTLFTKALHPVASLRATHPEEVLPLVTHLLQQYNTGIPPAQMPTSLSPRERKRPIIRGAEPSAASSSPGALSISVQQTTPLHLSPEYVGALPRPEELPPLPVGQDGWAACLWTCQILLCLTCLFLLAS
jgi:hypothetical protein